MFFAAPEADAACQIGTEVLGAVGNDGVLPPARGAVGVGAVSPHAGDYYGPLVNLLARLVKVGGPGELVVTGEAAAALAPGRWSLHELEPAALRGVDESVRAFIVTPIVV